MIPEIITPVTLAIDRAREMRAAGKPVRLILATVCGCKVTRRAIVKALRADKINERERDEKAADAHDATVRYYARHREGPARKTQTREEFMARMRARKA